MEHVCQLPEEYFHFSFPVSEHPLKYYHSDLQIPVTDLSRPISNLKCVLRLTYITEPHSCWSLLFLDHTLAT